MTAPASPTAVAFAAEGTGWVAALDIGGTKIAAAVVGADGSVRSRVRAATVAADGEHLFELVAGLLERSITDCGLAAGELDAIGVGCGGPMEVASGTVSPLNIAQWRGFPLRDRLARRFGRPVHLDNDAKALALGEGWVGAAPGARDYLAMVVSTGVGGGIVCDGRLLDGAGGNAGHLGHVIVEPTGRPCRCGARGCLEAEASGTAIAEMTGAPAAEADHATRVRTGRLVGRAVGSVVNLLDLRLAVVAGSVALGFGDVFFEAANEELGRVARLDFSRGARIVPTGCGEDGPILGAAAVARVGLGLGGVDGAAR